MGQFERVPFGRRQDQRSARHLPRRNTQAWDYAAPNAPVNFGANRPALASVSEAFKHNGITNAIELGRKLVNGIVITHIGKTRLQLSVPTVDVPDMLQGFSVGQITDGEPMIRSFLTVVWGLYEAVCEEREKFGTSGVRPQVRAAAD